MPTLSMKWIRSGVAVTAVVVGMMLVGKPFLSLEWLPVVVVVSAPVIWLTGARVSAAAVVTLYLAALAITAIISPFWSAALALYGALAWMILAGVVRLLSIRQRRWGSATYGLALVLLAVCSVYWLDLASIILGLMVGPALLVAGGVILWRTHGWKTANGRHTGAVLGRMGASALVVLALVVAVLTVRVENSTPKLDSFATSSGALGDAPGVLLASEPFTQGMPAESLTHRILYTTTDIDGEITTSTGLVILPKVQPDPAFPVVLWAHGTTGIASHCAPSLLADPLGAGAMLFPERALEQGWAIVAPDYLGLGTEGNEHPYLVGRPTAHSALDAVRAARQLDTLRLSDETVVWGHSQGGGTALSIGIEQPDYAPDVPLLGIPAMSPATDLLAFAATALSSLAGPIFGSFMIHGYAAAYDDVAVNDIVRPGARFSQERVAARCLSDRSTIASLISALITEDWTRGDLEDTAFYTHLGANVPMATVDIPVFVGQGLTDTLILPEVQSDFVARLCAMGGIVEYHTYAGKDHMGVVEEGSPLIDDLIVWTMARFTHETPLDTCVVGEPG